ncbi:sensor histidine kinase [Cohnella fermenti]|uniref:histidine kinase n=1 Tax=Cohnella fermenti TaxID=2565925 RepID=A0A4S4CE48_9BACL|nr:HAMP domain-containing sensor histidine kinase [Cohnella fermenti]THF84248.1 HAMP domain-containing histidine kinase [Cohnella fermenti]
MFIFFMFLLFFAIAIFCLTQQKYTRATLFMLGMGLSFLLVVSGIMTYMAKDAYYYYRLYGFFGITRDLQNQLLYLPISRYMLIRGMNVFSMSFLYCGLLSAVFFAFNLTGAKSRRLLSLLAVPCVVQIVLYDPSFYEALYYRLYPDVMTSQAFVAAYELIHRVTFVLNTGYIGGGIFLLVYAFFDAPKLRQIRSNIAMILISYVSLQVTYYYINFWAPDVLITVSKAARFVRFKPINLVGNPSMYALLPYIVGCCLFVSLYGIVKYARIQNRIRNQESVISRNIDSAVLTSRVYSHYMKNELLGIMAQTEFLEAMCEESPEVVREIKVIEQRCRGIYDRLDDVHKKTMKSKMELEPVLLQELLGRLLAELAPRLKRINVHYEPRPQPITIMADPYYFSQVLENLLANAAEALASVPENSRRIDIETNVKHKWVELIVRDNGVGIPEEHLAEIFQPFFSSKPTATNWGVGLSLSHSIVTTHGGKIGAVSKPGEGTSFRIVMPLLRTSKI